VLREKRAGARFVRNNRTCDGVSYHCHLKGNCPLSDVATDVDLRFDVPQSGMSSPILDHDHVSLSTRTAILVTADVVGVALIGLVIFRLYASPLKYDESQMWSGLASFLIGWILASWTQDLYGRKVLLSGARVHCQHGLVACALTFGVVLLIEFALKFIGGVSRVWLLTWAISDFVWLGGLRSLWAYCLHRSLRRGKCIDRALVLVGSSRHARHLRDAIERESRGEIAVVSVMGIPGTPGGIPIDRLDEIVRAGMVDRVIIANFEGVIEQSRAVLVQLMRVAVDVTLIPDLAELRAPVLSVDRIGMLAAIDLASRPLTAIEVALKRAEDVLLSSLILLLTAPVFLVIALAIRLDSSGPVLFGQLREGYHNKVFKVWKFRTMYHAARDESAVRQTSRDDRRVTRVGRILRRLSLDELPQLINVIRGEMSVVGPRPHALGMTSVGLPMTQVLDGYAARHRLKPGITGWAQVNGCRGEVDSHEKLRRRVSLDCYYIDHWSLSLDIWIIIRTAALLAFDSHAY
jgi:Undecaprenyl-phosphate glucose phosphotransferase